VQQPEAAMRAIFFLAMTLLNATNGLHVGCSAPHSGRVRPAVMKAAAARGTVETSSRSRSPPPVSTAALVTTSDGPASEYLPLTMQSLQDSQPATIALTLVIGYVALGVAYYWQTTDWGLLQSMYFVIVTLTSVGYGDLAPTGEGARLFTAAYILFGVGIVGTALGEVVSSLLNVDATPAGRMIKWLSGAGGSEAEAADADVSVADGTQSEMDIILSGSDAKTALVSTLLTVGGTLVLGALAFLELEPGTSLSDAIYYAVVTVTTVGYGDFTPQTSMGQAFVSGYAFFGTILLARALGAVAALPLERRRLYQQQLVLEQYGGELDAEELDDLQTTLADLGLCHPKRDFCTKSDFALAMLVRQDKLTRADVQAALGTFDKLDIDGSGELDEGDVQAWLDDKAKRKAE